MKRLLIFIMVILLSFPAITNSVIAQSNQYTSLELKRAVSLGIGTYQKNATVTYKQFFKMLDATVQLSNPKKLTEWKKKFSTARASTKKMTRQEGMLALLYAAETLGEEYCTYNSTIDWGITNKKLGESCWTEMTRDYTLLPGWKQPTTIANKWDNHMDAAYFYSFSRESIYSGKTVFDIDQKSNSMRLKAAFTYEEALLAAIRLHDSNLHVEKRIPTKEDKVFFNSVDARREAILNSRTAVAVRGTSYYVSNNGSDENDGLSPSTAWLTLTKVNTTALKPGDGVFFERGGLWRSTQWKGDPSHCGNGVLYAQNGVTYSAYGSGQKPKLIGSPENGADPGKWELLPGTENIWVFYKDIQDCGGIVLNQDERVAQKTCAFWDGSKYYRASDGKKADTPRVLFDVKKLDNESFFNDIVYPGKEAAGHFSLEGKLYFRCDKGNPGSVYKSMEFLTGNNDWNQGFASGQDGCVFDNLCFMYGTGTSVINNCIVQNCEIGWLGGQILDYSGSSLGDDSEGQIVRCGDGIMSAGDNDILRNNYIHHNYDNGITIEGYSADPAETAWKREKIIIEGNIVEKCFGGLLITDWYAWQKNLNHPSFNDISIANNYFISSGYGWSHQEAGVISCSIGLVLHPGSIKNIKISNNVFYVSKFSLVQLWSDAENKRPDFSGNTYVQDAFGNMIQRIIKNPSNTSEGKYIFSPYTQVQSATEVLGDKTAKFFN